jgi:antitoxin VapB
LLVTPSGLHLITDSIEAPRLEKEQKLKEQGWEFHVHLWHEQQEIVSRLTGGLKLGADVAYPGAVDLSSELARLRGRLTPEEGERFRDLGRLCAEAMNAAIRAVQPGQSEFEIAALLDFETERRGVQPIVNLIATDERIFAYHHPLPTGKILDRYAMLVMCGRRDGLICSVTAWCTSVACQMSSAAKRSDGKGCGCHQPGDHDQTSFSCSRVVRGG